MSNAESTTRTHAEPAPNELIALLAQHTGDRSIYLLRPRDRQRLRAAQRLGLVEPDGALTSHGYRLWLASDSGPGAT